MKKEINTLILRIVLCLMPLLLAGCTALNGLGFPSKLPCPIPAEMMSSPGEGSVNLTLVNQSCTTICRVYLSPRPCDDWGSDWLQGGRVRSGEQFSLDTLPGRVDLLLEDCSEAEYIIEDLDLDSDSVWTFSEQGDSGSESCRASVTVENHSAEPICHMWIASPISEQFGNNWLGDAQIPGGGEFTFIVPEGTYDLKAEGCAFEFLRVELDVPIGEHIRWPVP